jgi:hypothetical protein
MHMLTVSQGPLRFAPGEKLLLTERQAQPRAAALKQTAPAAKGAALYEVLAPVEFKAGEKLGYAGAALPKSLLDRVAVEGGAGPAPAKPTPVKIEPGPPAADRRGEKKPV